MLSATKVAAYAITASMLFGSVPVLAQTGTGSGPAATTTSSSDADRNSDHWGWLGLVGLIGLAGLARRSPNRYDRTTTTDTRARPMT
jgi:MYXO-CTERM domain-containing protein